ncbi:glycosyltransferase family A protein [Microbacterium soli]|uniref:Glycosyltransferase 2-like domain-containing protein n=1 Tax=Microbacterium soli TaxID=446075 RepID=A0ABP7MXC6_9MICO
MTPAPSISCIIPTHQRDDMLLRAIDSVLSQTVSPAEVIVADDTGSDTTRALVERIDAQSEVPVRYVDARNEFNSAGASRNAGVEVSSGELIACLDDDDAWHPRFLEATQRALQAETRAELAVSWVEQIRGDKTWPGETIRAGHSPSSAAIPPAGMSGGNFLITREAWSAIGGFDPRARGLNDADFFIRYLESGRDYVVVEERLLRRHLHDLGQLTTKSLGRVEALRYFYAKHEAKFSRAQKREMRRMIHSQLRVADPSWVKRIYHLFGQLLTGNPVRPVVGVWNRLRGFTYSPGRRG